jgi:hypothetical protein
MMLSRPAKPEEYAPLAQELTQQGYDLDIKKRVTKKMDATRRKNAKPLYLWLSLGEGSYENYGDDMTALALAAYDQGVTPPLHWHNEPHNTGFDCPGFTGPVSYVGLYWGDSDAQFERGLDSDERRHFEKELAIFEKEYARD